VEGPHPDSAIYKLLQALAANEARRLLREAATGPSGSGYRSTNVQDLTPLPSDVSTKKNQ
jgi:hypothetical protein